MDAARQYDALIAAYQRFGPLTADAEDALRAAHTPRFVEKGSLWLRAGTVCDCVGFIVEGALHMFYETAERRTSVQFVFENGITADYGSFLRQSPARLNIEALESTFVLEMGYNAMQQLYATVPSAERIGRKVAEFLFMAVSERNDSFILDDPELRYRKLVETRPKVMQRVPLYMIASYLGITPEALSRIRRRITK